MTPVLFLDIDGVLNGHDWHDGAQSNTIRRTCIEALSLILTEANPKVVISSAWRYMILGRSIKPAGFEYLLRTHGLVGIAGRILGTTCADEDCSHCGTKHRKRRWSCNGKGWSRSKSGFDEHGRFVCGACEKPSSRGDQISRWLREHDPVFSYVVLDDEDYGITEAGHPLIQTDGACGLTREDAMKAIALLQRELVS